jgi:putative endopeptidase
VPNRITKGENIADLGGLTASYYAMQTYLETSDSLDLLDISGYNAAQLFFISFAQLWRRKMRKEAEIKLVKTDPHSPNKFRVNGVLTNMVEFYENFGVLPGEKLYKEKEDRVEIF